MRALRVVVTLLLCGLAAGRVRAAADEVEATFADEASAPAARPPEHDARPWLALLPGGVLVLLAAAATSKRRLARRAISDGGPEEVEGA